MKQSLTATDASRRSNQRELSGDRRDEWEKNQLREALRVATRGIQQASAPLLLDKINALAVNFRENKAEIDHLR